MNINSLKKRLDALDAFATDGSVQVAMCLHKEGSNVWNCSFGGEHDIFNSEEEARAFIDTRLANLENGIECFLTFTGSESKGVA